MRRHLKPLLPAAEHPSICADATGGTSLHSLFRAGWRGIRSTSPWEVCEITGAPRASFTSCVMNTSTAIPSAAFWKPETSYNALRTDYNDSCPHSSVGLPNTAGVSAAQLFWAPVTLCAHCAVRCRQHQSQPKITASRSSNLNFPTCRIKLNICSS